MSKQKQMSAKDKAFERERARLQSIIRKKDDELLNLTNEVNKYKTEIESLQKNY